MSGPEEFHLGTTALQAGVTLLEASAGTGKTYTISGIIVRLIAIEELALRNILVVTFTEAATLELRERIRARLMQVDEELATRTHKDPVIRAIELAGVPTDVARRRIALALASFDEATISTIHGFCQKLLRDNAFEGNAPFQAEVIRDTTELVYEVAHDFWQQQQDLANPFVAALAQYAELTPDDGASLLLKLSRHPDLQILPSKTLSSAEAMKILVAVGEDLRNRWRRDGDRLLQLFDHPGISKDKSKGFGKDRLRKFGNALAAWSDSSVISPDAIQAIDAMRSEAIESKRLVAQTKKGLRFPDDAFFDLCSRFAEARQAWTAALRHEFLSFAVSTLPKLKAVRAVMSFDDMLTLTRDALRGVHADALMKAVRSQYRAALIDEFQDTDPLQYEIFSKLFAQPPQILMLIGDPKQSIYGFRGADLFTYLGVHRALSQSNPSRIRTLRTNYRSSVELVEAVNHLFAQQENCFRAEEIRFLTAYGNGERAAKQALIGRDEKSTAPLVMVTVSESDETRESIASDVVLEIRELLRGYRLAERALQASDIAVLVRSHHEAANIEEKLRSMNIPVVRQTQQSVFDSPEADELLRILDAVLEPGNPRVLRTALTASCFGMTADTLLHLEANDAEWTRWVDTFSRLRDRWQRRGFASMFRDLIVNEGLRRRLVSQRAGERKLTNLLHLGELAQDAEHHDHLAPAGVVTWIRAQQAKPGTRPEQYIQRLDTDDDAVRLVTIHNAKGLEYPVVFCPSHGSSKNVKDVLFHEEHAPFRMTLDLSDEVDSHHKALAAAELLAEDVRLLYVAVTRAVQRCYLYVTETKESLPPKSAVAAVLGGEAIATARELARRYPQQIGVRECRRQRLEMTVSTSISSTVEVSAQAAEISAREPERSLAQGLMVGSFSRLVSGAAEERAQDHDDLPASSPVENNQEQHVSPIFRLPRGAATGIALHAVLEHVDFRQPAALHSLVDQYFAPLLLDDDLRGAVREQLAMLLQHPLPAADRVVRLAEVGPDDRINEAEFYYPVRSFTTRELATVCKADNASSLPNTIERLQFDPLDGYLRGFMDLVFRHQGRYYLADWKSNWLGNSTEDYAPQRLDRAMADNFYHLQSWLYALALQRFLASRLPDYQYEQHFGGIFYIFVRGLDPAVAERGVHFARPTRNFLQNLGDVVFGDGGNDER